MSIYYTSAFILEMVEAGFENWNSDKQSVNALLLCINSISAPLSLSWLKSKERGIERVQVGGSWSDTVYIFSTMSANT